MESREKVNKNTIIKTNLVYTFFIVMLFITFIVCACSTITLKKLNKKLNFVIFTNKILYLLGNIF